MGGAEGLCGAPVPETDLPMKINGNEIKPGNVIKHQDTLWVAVKADHVKPGKGGAFAQVELKNLLDGRKLNERFRSADKVEKVRLEQKDHQFLYPEGEMLVFMDTENYEQTSLPVDFVGEERAAYLTDGMMVVLEIYEEKPIGIELPKHVELEVIETEPVVKGQTAANSFKPALLTGNIRTAVPPFVGVGERIVVATEDGSYVRRAE
jgi:elongation factor P